MCVVDIRLTRAGLSFGVGRFLFFFCFLVVTLCSIGLGIGKRSPAGKGTRSKAHGGSASMVGLTQ